MGTYETTLEVAGPWSLRTSARFWESFTPAALPPASSPDVLHVRFLSEHDWTPVEAQVTQEQARQDSSIARIVVSGVGDLTAATRQVVGFLSLGVDATDWPRIGEKDAVIGAAQRALPGFRPCGFTSPYEAACWAVLSQRTRIPEAAKMRQHLIRTHGRESTFPAPAELIRAIEQGELRLPGRKGEYLAHLADAALSGLLTSTTLRAMTEDEARARLQSIIGVGPFAADLILVRGCNTVDVLPRAERRLDTEIAHLYGADANLATVAEGWRPFRSWAAVHLRALREARLHEMS